MKKVKGFLAGMMILFFAMSISPLQTKAQVQVSVNFQCFYDNLSPYGTWAFHPNYGNVWIPNVPVGFRPYFSNGNWIFTNDGWMWVSYYDWGWAPFHYGSWLYDSFYGWMWIPGYDWAPAWVVWGNYSDYYGWAPMGPDGYFNVSYYPPIDYWVFVHPRHMTVPGWNNHYYLPYHNHIVFDNHVSIFEVRNINVVKNEGHYNGRGYYYGPRRGDFEKITNRRLEVITVRDNDRPGRANVKNREVDVYRPRVNETGRNTAKPSNVIPIERYNRSTGNKTNIGDNNNINARGNEDKTTPSQRYNESQSGKKTVPEQNVKGRGNENKVPSSQRYNEGQKEKKAVPEQKMNVRENRQQNSQSQMKERKSNTDRPAKSQEHKSETKQKSNSTRGKNR